MNYDKRKPNSIVWPDGKKFAFALFDDTDMAALAEVREIYSFLLDNAICATKSVWVFDSPYSGRRHGTTCEQPEYVEWLLQIRERGVEIAYHNAGHDSSDRERIICGLDRFAELFGGPPRSYACHAECRENIYWGAGRFTTPHYRALYNLLTGFRKARRFQGHVEGSRWFWGDICIERIRYIRNFIFRGINTLAVCPIMPYHDPARPFVNLWFASADGSDATRFAECLREENQDRLEEEGGACIISIHAGKGFCSGGELHPDFVRLVKRLARKNGWFVPVSVLLDHLVSMQGEHIISDAERAALERAWLRDRMGLSISVQ